MNTNKKIKINWKFSNIVFIIFSICIFLLYIQFAYLSLSNKIYGKDMDTFAQNRNTVTQTIEAIRGNIYDNSSNLLALNVSSYTVVAYLEKSKSYQGEDYVKDIDATATSLATVLSIEKEDLITLLSSDKYQVELGPEGRGITELKKEEIEELNLSGIGFIEKQKRYYPNGDFASYVIGYAKDIEVTTNDENGNEITTTNIIGELGIESEFNDLLTGTDGYLTYQKDLYGYKIAEAASNEVAAKNGYDIYLTIDATIQRFLETEVKNLYNNYSPEWVNITVMDAKTGDILGTASGPSFDPNVRNITNYENPLVSMAFEPGSTMKTYTYMCAMENGVYDENATYVSGSYQIGSATISDWNVNGFGTISFDKGFEYSSNLGIVNLVTNYITKKQLRECFEKYGFGQLTGIDLNREVTGNIDFNYAVEVATAGFGQGITTTAIQQLQALTIISNNGKMLIPHIVSKIVDSNTDELYYEREIEESEQLVKKSTITKIKELMYNVVQGTDTYSTGYPYRIDGFDIIGKTGTSQIYSNDTKSYLTGDNSYIFSFAGMYPNDDPEIIIYAAMKQPTWGRSSSLSTATKSIMESIAKYKNMFTEVTSNPTLSTFSVESYINKDCETVKKELEEKGIDVVIIGDGKKIVSQSVDAGSLIMDTEKIIFVTNSTNITLPSLIGWSRSEVINLFDLLNIKYNIEGYGYVTNQSIDTNTVINKETEITVKLEDKFDENTITS
ncbi:MAG: penicillin-binding protein [Bacilli bacterium]